MTPLLFVPVRREHHRGALSIRYGNERFATRVWRHACGTDCETITRKVCYERDGRKTGQRNSCRKAFIQPTHFFHHALQAESVELAGDFNHWKPFPMQRRGDGWWFLQVMLGQGHHQYRFLVDGKPVLDPRAMGVVRNQMNEEVSVVAVS